MWRTFSLRWDDVLLMVYVCFWGVRFEHRISNFALNCHHSLALLFYHLTPQLEHNLLKLFFLNSICCMYFHILLNQYFSLHALRIDTASTCLRWISKLWKRRRASKICLNSFRSKLITAGLWEIAIFFRNKIHITPFCFEIEGKAFMSFNMTKEMHATWGISVCDIVGNYIYLPEINDSIWYSNRDYVDTATTNKSDKCEKISRWIYFISSLGYFFFHLGRKIFLRFLLSELLLN